MGIYNNNPVEYFQNGDTSGNTGNQLHLCFFKWKGPILISNFDSMLNFEFRTSFCKHLSVIVFDLSSFRKKEGLQGFIKKCVTPQPLEINNCFFFFVEFLKAWPIFCAASDIFVVS
jgi:hypothetical protein